MISQETMLAQNNTDFQKDVIRDHLNNIDTKGFTVIHNCLTELDCSRGIISFYEWIRRNFNYARQHLDQDSHFQRVVNLHSVCPDLAKLFESSKVLGILDSFFNSEAVIYTSLYFEKGTQQPIHRDNPVFHTVPSNLFLGVWFALEDANEENGCLEIIPGGHKVLLNIDTSTVAKKFYSDLNDINHSDEALWMEYQRLVLEQCDKNNLTAEKVHVKAGDVVIWHPLAPHGGSEIRNIRLTRHSIVMHVIPKHISVYGCDLFFNQDRAPWKDAYQYELIQDRYMARSGSPHFQGAAYQ